LNHDFVQGTIYVIVNSQLSRNVVIVKYAEFGERCRFTSSMFGKVRQT